MKLPAAAIEPARWRRERAATAKVSAVRCSKGVPPNSCVSASTIGGECPYRTDGHRNHESGRSEYLSNKIQKSFFHIDLQHSSKGMRMAGAKHLKALIS